MRRDLGDFQTPPALAASVLDTLGPIGDRWPRVLEPSCGRGHFLTELLRGTSPPREIQGIEIQEAHCAAARDAALECGSSRVEIHRADLFALDLQRDLAWREHGPLLVVGNPPWVTNSELGTLGSGNHPRKVNLKGLKGIDARTGASNFDIAEGIWLKLIAELSGDAATIALLCKTSVARGILQFAGRAGLPIAEASLTRIDARRWFGAAVDACLFRVVLGPNGPLERVPVFAGLGTTKVEKSIGIRNGRLIADLESYQSLAFADGHSSLTWRQGLKHDAAAVMELARDRDDGPLRNKGGDPVDVEPAWVYPLVKGADLIGSKGRDVRRAVIVTQRRIGQETKPIEGIAPRLWSYLSAHAGTFAGRKSSIYRGQPPFAMFGLGPYSFSPYKVAVSGLAKTPRFSLIGPVGGRPVMLDDTCYFLPCRSPEQAALTAALLNDPATLGLIRSLTFLDAKRPITKTLLQRIDLTALAGRLEGSALLERAGRELDRLDAQQRGDGTETPIGNVDLVV